MTMGRGWQPSFRYGNGGNDAFTKLLLHCDGANGSTVFTDVSLGSTAPHVITPSSLAVVTSSQFRFGTGSASVGPRMSRLVIPDSADWYYGAGDFTIDFWVRFSGSMPSDDVSFVWQGDGAGSGPKITSGLDYLSSRIYFYAQFTASSIACYYYGPHGMVADTWYQVAYVRNGANFATYKNGASISLTSDTPFTANSSMPDSVDSLTLGSALSGVASTDPTAYAFGPTYMDEIRISKGIARWTSSFSPPGRAYA